MGVLDVRVEQLQRDRMGEHAAAQVRALLGQGEHPDHLRLRDRPADPQAGRDALGQRAQVDDRAVVGPAAAGRHVQTQQSGTGRFIELEREIRVVLDQPGAGTCHTLQQRRALVLGHEHACGIGEVGHGVHELRRPQLVSAFGCAGSQLSRS